MKRYAHRHGLLGLGLLVSVSVLGLLGAPAVAGAQTLEEALIAAYQNNPQVNSYRQRLKATDERLPQARAGWRPTVTMSGSIGKSRLESDSYGPKAVELDPKQVSATITQPLYRGGRTVAGIERSKQEIQAERARLQSTEQSVLLETTTAYLNVLRDQAVVELNSSNQQVLNTQLTATRDRFRVGEVTRTDVSQAEARLAGVVADRINAEGVLETSRATFEKMTGLTAKQLKPPAPPLAQLPTSLEEAQNLASRDNPAVVAAQFDEGAARNSIDEVTGELLPTVNLVGTISRNEGTQIRTEPVTSAQITAQVSMPLYEGGGTYSRVRAAKQVAGQRRTDIEVARRAAIEAATQAYQSLGSARARIESLKSQIRAAEVALEGVRQEQTVGSRTVLDVLNAEQELLNSQVSLVRSQRDALVAAYQLLSATGRMTAKTLNLPVSLYDVEANFNEVSGKWIGTGITGE